MAKITYVFLLVTVLAMSFSAYGHPYPQQYPQLYSSYRSPSRYNNELTYGNNAIPDRYGTYLTRSMTSEQKDVKMDKEEQKRLLTSMVVGLIGGIAGGIAISGANKPIDG